MTQRKLRALSAAQQESPMADLIPFHDRDGSIWMNGQMIPWREANLHVLSHGLHYASAVFEGERSYGGKIFKLREHTDRLIASAGMLDMEIPYTPDQIDAACNAVIKANNLVDGYVRPIAWRGSEMMGVSAQHAKINARHPDRHRHLPPPRPGDDPVEGQGHWPLHDLHA
jgi:branched-chain amino acid aminotransferase